jgi:HdeA/HdeB family protein
MVRGYIRMAFVAVALGMGCLSGPARAQSNDLPCDAFAKNADGLWYATRNADIPGTGESLTIRQGSILRPGAAIRGLDFATMLDRECPAAAAAPQPAVTAPAGAPPAQQQAAQPRAALSRYADANGNIDVRRLTCGEIADSPPQEAEFFLSWYSGWYSGEAKKRGINLARVRYAIGNVLEYCKANPDKRIVQVMDLMLK